MTRASAPDQRRLLDVQAIDTKLGQALHRRDHLEAAASLAKAREALARAEDVSATAAAELGDVQRELTRAEDEVEKVRARQDRDNQRLESGGGLARELQAIQNELEALARRRSDLEDLALEAMEKVDGAQHVADGAAQVLERLHEEAGALEARVEAAYGEIDAEMAGLRAERDAAAHGLDEALIALYERLRDGGGGIGAAPLRAGRCEGCRLELNAGDLTAIRAAAEDEVVRCEECGRILVRVGDSGL